MKKFYFFLFSLFGILFGAQAQTTINIYSDVTFYDGYAGLVSHATAPDVVRLRNDLFTKKLTPAVLAQIGTTLRLDITIGALCDNYDRIGNVNLALVPKNATSYDPNTTQRIELARFITPFMNKNISPTTVPYSFTVDNAAKILTDTYLNASYDFWLELQVFGVPYAAQTQVSGCSGRNDVFLGSLNFVTNTTMATPNNTLVLPLNFQKDLNNYATGASDAEGTTRRTINFNLPAPVNNAKFYLITSNHGANAGGEEYNRRWHYIYFDGPLILNYRPGEPTCEPYRVYNTQGNGIYGPTPRSNSQWQSFSNWCPGSVIAIRQIDLGNLVAGQHTFIIDVPTAVFADGQGYIPVSLYLQAENTVLGTEVFSHLEMDCFPNPTSGNITVRSNNILSEVQFIDMQGRVLIIDRGGFNEARLDISGYSKGVYFVKADFGGEVLIRKVIKE